MGFTFTAGTLDPVSGVLTYKAVTDTTSAAGTINCGFAPRAALVLDQTGANKYEWNDQMPAASLFKTVTAGTFTYATANGFTQVVATGTAPATPGITLGTAIFASNTTYTIVLYR